MGASEISQKLFPIFSGYPIWKAVLFGSYAKGTFGEASDIDIMIDSKGEIKGIDFFGVLEDISDAVQKPVDLLESSQVIPGGKIEKEIEKTGVVIYERA